MKKTLATLLAVLMLVSVVSLSALAADITVDGDVSEWTAWTTVSATDDVSENGTVQNTTGKKLNRSYDYAVKVVGDTLYVAVKQADAAVAAPAGEAVVQTNCTNVRLWIDNDPATPERSALFDFGFDGEKIVESRANNDGTNKIASTAACKFDEGYSVEIAIKLADLGIVDNKFSYAITLSAPDYAAGGSFIYDADNASVVMNIPTDILEANTEYTMRATAAFKNVNPASGSCFVNFYYGTTWGDMFAVTADQEMGQGNDMKFTTGETFETVFYSCIGAWGQASGQITVQSIQVLKGEEVVWEQKFETIPEGLEAGRLGGEYAALHSIVYAKGTEPWTTTANYTVYSEPVEAPDTGDSAMIFALIALVAMAGTVVAVKKAR